jgi:hypothetical protein
MNFKLDYDAGVWRLTIEGDAVDVTLGMDDQEGFELLDALAPLVDRRDTYEDMKQMARGATLAGFLEQPWVARGVED